MTKIEVLDDVIELLIRKAAEEDQQNRNLRPKSSEQLLSRSEKENGVYSSPDYRKQA